MYSKSSVTYVSNASGERYEGEVSWLVPEHTLKIKWHKKMRFLKSKMKKEQRLDEKVLSPTEEI